MGSSNDPNLHSRYVHAAMLSLLNGGASIVIPNQTAATIPTYLLPPLSATVTCGTYTTTAANAPAGQCAGTAAGASCPFACYTGYALSTPPVCLATGTWDPQITPTCTQGMCTPAMLSTLNVHTINIECTYYHLKHCHTQPNPLESSAASISPELSPCPFQQQ